MLRAASEEFDQDFPGFVQGIVNSLSLRIMGHLKFDPSFERDGKSLAEWLPLLVGDDRQQRLSAANALGGMWRALPGYDTHFEDMDAANWPDLVVQDERFKQAIRDAVARPGFPAAVFVRRLMLFRMSLHEDWLRRVAKMGINDE